jgi:cytochrome c oxidase assembly protein subunit 15
MRWLGVAALGAVILQGVLGGLRVTWIKDEIGILHATLAQFFFALLCSIALFSSQWWRELGASASANPAIAGLRKLCTAAALLIVAQLVIGATMRHQHAGLAIPDFPAAYGGIWPATDSASVAHYNQVRTEATALNPITAFQIVLQMAHRITALGIVVSVALVAVYAFRKLREMPLLRRLALGWSLLVVGQAILGAATIWTNKSADIATAHVAFGALSLVNGTMLVLVCGRYLWKATPQFALEREARDSGITQAQNPVEAPA